MRVTIFGAGAIGSLFGALLSQACEVTLIGRKAHVVAIRKRGLQVSGHTRRIFHVDAATSPKDASPADLVILTTKAYDTAAAARALRRAGVRAPVLSLQNGLANIPTLRKGLPRVAVLGGSTTHGVTSLGPGRIRHAGVGDTTLGIARGSASIARDVARLFSRAGIPTRLARDLDSVLWQKAIVNTAINPLTAVLRCPNGEILKRPDALFVSRLAALEAAAAARAAGVRVPLDPWPGVERVLRQTAANRSSMLQDVESGRRTEVDAITGEIVRTARRFGVDAPTNASLLALVRALER